LLILLNKIFKILRYLKVRNPLMLLSFFTTKKHSPKILNPNVRGLI
jgi:hypothetical protein